MNIFVIIICLITKNFSWKQGRFSHFVMFMVIISHFNIMVLFKFIIMQMQVHTKH